MLEYIINAIDSLGYLGIALLMALETVIPPIPSEIIMPLAGFTVTQGELKLSLVIIAGTIGSVLGAVPWYFLGKYWGLKRIKKIVDRYGKWATISGKDLDKVKTWFDRRGDLAVFFGRLVPGIRTYISLPAGINKMPLWSFFLFSLFGTLLWVSFLTGTGYILGENYEQVGIYLKPISTAVLLGILAIAIYGLIARKLASYRK